MHSLADSFLRHWARPGFCMDSFRTPDLELLRASPAHRFFRGHKAPRTANPQGTRRERNAKGTDEEHSNGKGVGKT